MYVMYVDVQKGFIWRFVVANQLINDSLLARLTAYIHVLFLNFNLYFSNSTNFLFLKFTFPFYFRKTLKVTTQLS